MDLYYYCSYDNSPVGFYIGKIPAVDSLNLMPAKKLELSKENINPFIRKCFESGLIRNVFGKVPEEFGQGYFLMKKKMVHKIENRNYYMSIALTGLRWNEFSDLMKVDSNDTKEKLAKLVAESISQNKTNDFGYEVRSEVISRLIGFKYAGICKCNKERMKKIQEDDCLYAELLNGNPDKEEIGQLFGEQFEMIKESGTEVRIGKKNECRVKKLAICLIGVVVLALITWLIIFRTKT